MTPTDRQCLWAFWDRHDLIAAGDHILVALSGGADSMCLLGILLETARERSLTLSAAHYNHCLRGAESARDRNFCAVWCAEKGVPFFTEDGDVSAAARKAGRGLEETARIMRYDFLTRTASALGATKIATAHTADDNVETVLMHMARGTGLAGLSGIPPVRGTIIRPILPLTRSDVERLLAAGGIPHVEDATNAGDAHTRNRIRHQAVPALRDINPDLGTAVLGLTERVRADADYLDTLAEAQYDALFGKTHRGSAAALAALPAPIRTRVIALALEALDVSAAARHIAATQRLAESAGPSGEIHLPGGARVRREYTDLVFSREPAADETFATVQLEPGIASFLPELGLWIQAGPDPPENQETFQIFCFKSSDICGKIAVRPRLEGDEMCIFGRNCTKSLKKLMIEKRIPRHQRGRIPVLADEAGVLAALGMGVDRRVAPEDTDSTVYVWMWEAK